MFNVTADRHIEALDELERIRFRIDRFLLMPRHEDWLRREAFVRQAYTSTMIETATVTEQDRERAESDLTIDESSEAANYARAREFVDFLSENEELEMDQFVIRQINWQLMRGIIEPTYRIGEYRRETNWVQEAGVRVYEPPHAMDVPVLMADFAYAIRNSDLHPILRAGVAHIHLVAIHPFVDGNGRTGRLLATLILQNSGWGFRNLLSLDHYYYRNRDDYVSALAETLGPKFPDEYEADPWLDFFCDSIVAEARRLEIRLTEWRMVVDEIQQELQPIGLSERQIDGLLYATRTGSIARRHYIEITGVSAVTATRDLKDLAARGLLEARGATRNRVYYLHERFRPRPDSKPKKVQLALIDE